MKIAGLTDIGSCRQENQDSFCARQLTDGSGWGVVCDGMGGVKGGRVASAIATASMLQYFDRQLRCLRHGEEKQFILHGFDLTNRAVYDKATSDPEMLGMGTTGVCAYVFGNMADLPRLTDIARRYHLALIEDATEALGTRYTAGPFAGRMAGTIGDVGVYSFNGNKIITTGAGGMVVSNHPDWAEHAKHLSTQAKSNELQFFHDEVGYNYRMTNLQAALGLAQLEQLEGFIAHKHARWQQYKDALDGVNGYRILGFREDCTRPNKWFYSLYLADGRHDRDTLIQKLKEQAIQTRPVWALIHQQADYGRNEAYAMEKAEDYRAHIVNLPCSTNLSEEDCQRVIDALLAL